ncbi:MAG: hypothetical protein D6692_00825 [Planctomycetota bacterium]|nr:MAG: hypothetical protein D6692_00825 [Planctomycetota bacterium]
MFLTLEDPRAKIQGSRDPLGAQPVWSGFGRHLVSNLTTVSNSVRGFTVLLLGRYFGELLIGDGRAEEHDALPIFLRTEQLCAYARFVVNEAEDTRGIERVRKFLNDSRSIQIEDGPEGWILGDQKTYGLWGLFSVPARVSGLLADGPVGLTDVARDFVENEYVPHLKPVMDRVIRLVRHGGPVDATKRNPVMKAMAAAMPPTQTPNELAFYGSYLRDASRAPGQHRSHRQQTLASLLARETDLNEWVGRRDIIALAEASKAEDAALAHNLRRVTRLEALLAPADLIFDFMLTRHGQAPSAVASALRDRWGSQVPNLDSRIDELLPEIADLTTSDLAANARVLDQALHHGDYETAVLTLLDWNREVMARRNAAPWVELSNGILDVRYRGTESELPSGDDLAFTWRNSYFLNSLKHVTAEIGEAA